jgi:putative hydrolase of the HAD superfamily
MDRDIHGILFDLGNTLMYLAGDWDEVVRLGAARLTDFFVQKRIIANPAALADTFIAERRAASEQAELTHRERTCAQALTAALQKIGAPPAAFDWVQQGVRSYFEPEEAAWTAYPDAGATLKALSGQGYRLGLLSNATDDALIQRLVNRLGLRPWLSPVFSSAKLGYRKPLRQPFDLVLSRWELHPQSVIMVGDTLNTDILGAQAAGMLGVLITTDEPPSNDRCREAIQPDATINSLSQLPALLKRWPAQR